MDGVQGPPVVLLVQDQGDRRGHRQGQGHGGRRFGGEAHGLVHRLRRERPVGARELQRGDHLGLGAHRLRRQAGHSRVGQHVRRGRSLRPDEAHLRRGEEQHVHSGRGRQGTLPVRREGMLHQEGGQADTGDILLRGPVQQVLHPHMVQRERPADQVGVQEEGLRGRRPGVRDPQGRGVLPHMPAEEVPAGPGLPQREGHQGGGRRGDGPVHLQLGPAEAQERGQVRRVDGDGGAGQELLVHAREGVQVGVQGGLHRQRGQPQRDDSQVAVRRPVRQGHARAHPRGLQAQEVPGC